jgi:NAD(P)-dependent dehydrogenase (short-subunit alcohol dehydrogenase family)
MKNRVVLITGSSNGIGRETARALASAKARMIITYCNDRVAGNEVAKQCRALGSPEVLLVRLDVRKMTSIRQAVERIVSKWGRIDILINNAAVAVWKVLREQDPSDIEDQVRTNLEGLIKMTLFCLPYVKDMIINIASGAGQTGYAELAPYCATKFGVRGFTQALAQEEPGINVYVVNPDMTKTRMTGYQGRPPEEVAQVVLRTAKGEFRAPSGSDINVWDILPTEDSEEV